MELSCDIYYQGLSLYNYNIDIYNIHRYIRIIERYLQKFIVIIIRKTKFFYNQKS